MIISKDIMGSHRRKGVMYMETFFQMLIFYSIEFIAIVAVAVAGVFVGKKLRDCKDKKSEKNAKNA